MLTFASKPSNRFNPIALQVSLGLLLLAALLTSSGCGRHAADAKDAVPPKAAAISTANAQRRTFHRLVEQPAWIEAFEETPIYPKISGYVEKVNVEIGARVHKDEVLAKVWVPELVEELKQKDGLVDQARIEIDQVAKTLEVARANAETSISLVLEAKAAAKRAAAQFDRWKSESDRMEDLTRAKVIDTQTREETLHQFRASQASKEEAEAKVQTSAAMQRESEAKRDKAEADLEAAKNKLALATTEQRRMTALLAYAEIKAPFDGVVSERHVNTGHLLQASAGTGERKQPLFVVVRTDRVRVFLDVPEADAVLIRPGLAARVRVPVLNDREFTGQVAGSSWSLESGQRTLRAEVDLENPDELLRPGMYAHASVPVEHLKMFSLPSAAVVIRDGLTFCVCVDDGKACKTVIRTGAKEGSNIEVLKKLSPASHPGERPVWDDFTGHEQVIVTNPADYTDGQSVHLEAGPKG